MEHGYAADPWFRFSNPEHRHWQLSMGALRNFRRLETRLHRFRRSLSDWDDLRHAALGVNSGDQERNEMPDPLAYPRRQLLHYTKVVRQSANPPRVCVIAHTHFPYLNDSFADGECMYVDAGAWTEGRSDFVVITNSEIAVCRYKRNAWPMAVPALRTAG